MNIRFTDLDHGYAAFASQDIPAGDTSFLDVAVEKSFRTAKSDRNTVTVGSSPQKWSRWGWTEELNSPRFSGEPPVVCMQTSDSRMSLPFRTCSTCLTPEIELQAELRRWFQLVDHNHSSSEEAPKNSAPLVKDILLEGDASIIQTMMQVDAQPTVQLTEIGLVIGVGVECGAESCCGLLAEAVGNCDDTSPRPLWFCCAACHDAFRLEVHQMDEDDAETTVGTVTTEEVLQGTGFAHENRIAELSLRQVLEQLRFIRQTFDERIWLVFLLLRAIVKTLEDQCSLQESQAAGVEEDPADIEAEGDSRSGSQDSADEVPSLHAAVSTFTERYDWGRLAMPTDGQRAVIRYAHRLIQRYLDFVQSCEIAFKQDLALQDVFQMRCALDANVHEVIVVNPVWAWSRLVLESVPNAAEHSTANTKVHSARSVEIIQKLLPLDRVHTFGVALFNVASKLNHSCSPNAKMLPTTAPCRGILRALGPIPSGTEIRISYLNLDEGEDGEQTHPSISMNSLSLESVLMGSTISKTEKQRLERQLMQNVSLRKAKLRANYGFECDCSRCESEWRAHDVQEDGAPSC